jgi:hypothetical protein
MTQFPSTVAGLPLRIGASFGKLNGSVFAAIEARGMTVDEMLRDLEMQFNACLQSINSGE